LPLRLGGRSTTPAGWGSAAYNTLMLGPCHRGHRRRTGQCSVPDDAGGRVLDQRVALSHRPRRKLGKLLGCGLPDGLVLTPATTDPAVARTWMRAHTGTGLEGVVAKRLDQPYRPGRRGWQKLRTRLTAEAVVGGITGPLKVPRELILGRPDDTGRLRIVGRTTPLRSPTAARLGALLEQQAHAWPNVCPGTAGAHRGPPTPVSAPTWSSRCPPTSLSTGSDGATPCGSSARGTTCRRATSSRGRCRRRSRSGSGGTTRIVSDRTRRHPQGPWPPGSGLSSRVPARSKSWDTQGVAAG
jgi:hypothetical protein